MDLMHFNRYKDPATIMWVVVLAVLSACGTAPRITQAVPESDPQTPADTENLWPYLDPDADSVPGISYFKAVSAMAKKQGAPVIVAVIDTGIETDHQAIFPYRWINIGEIEDNGLDDDGNGYIDDCCGWNFLGDMYYAQSEITRMRKHLALQIEQSSGATVGDSLVIAFNHVDSLYNIAVEKASKQYANLTENYNSRDTALMEYFNYVERQNMYHLNESINPRLMVKDNPNDIEDTQYGNNIVTPQHPDEKHGTHVAGIIASLINNTEAIRIMPVRTIPDGDEYDKDVALAIRYAVDNGASIINMSFGKGFSPQRKWVIDAMRYAESKDVLLVHGAGNEQSDMDKKSSFPGDVDSDMNEFVSNFINVGAITKTFDEELVAPFSNYGKKNVDLFAPGVSIYAALPDDTYGHNSGTSMAAPFVSGVAALIRHFYPSLSASTVKDIILQTGTAYDGLTIVPGTRRAVQFRRLSASGRILNAYNALKRADEL